MTSLEEKSIELKKLVSTYETSWFLGDLAKVMKAGPERANDQLGQLSSPQRQLYYLGGLLISSDPSNGKDILFTHEKWAEIVRLLNEVESEYDQLFFPKEGEEIDENWKKIRAVAMPSFLAYFNQGPLNYEEQTISWIEDVYSKLDDHIEKETSLRTNDFLKFYDVIDTLVQDKFQGFTSPKTGKFKKEWLAFTDLQMGPPDDVPDFIKEGVEENRPLFTFMADQGIINRFYADDIVTKDLPLDKIQKLLAIFTYSRTQTDFLYYTQTKPGNPLYDNPIFDIGNGRFQIFEVKQLLHAIENFLENTCSRPQHIATKLVDQKGTVLEDKIEEMFKRYFGDECKIFRGYFVDGNEQDLLILWKEYAFIIEAKGYSLREPLRDPERAFIRIKDDFNSSIGYGHGQTKRVAQKFIDQVPLKIQDEKGRIIETIDTTKYKDNDFSIIVTLKSFGQVQNNLETLLIVAEDEVYPYAVRWDDLEIFLLTLIAQKRSKVEFVDYLLLREDLHGKLICSDESEVMGGFITNHITPKIVKENAMIVTSPDLADVFDKQYNKGMGFKNEKLLYEKTSGKYLFW